MKNKIGFLGTGAYAIAIAKMFYENDCDILMWTKFKEEKEELEKYHESKKYFPGVIIPNEIKFTNDLELLAKHADILVVCLPFAYIKDALNNMKDFIKKDTIVVAASKGIDFESGKFIDGILEEYFKKDKIVVISGPSFAIDVVSNQPTGLSIAGYNNDNVNKVIETLANKYLRLVPTKDVLGIEICGAIKNVLAIASGILDGFNANPSCNAMFLTEAIHDVKLLIGQLGGVDRTILSYAGIGDILSTCTSTKSRNYTFGMMLVTKNKEEILLYRKNNTIEGLYTLDSIKKLIKDKDLYMPIINVIDGIVNHGEKPETLLNYLMNKKIITTN